MFDKYTCIDLVEESVFKDSSGMSFRNHVKSYTEFPVEPQIEEAGPSLHSSKKHQLQPIWKGFFVKNFLRCCWSYNSAASLANEPFIALVLLREIQEGWLLIPSGVPLHWDMENLS